MSHGADGFDTVLHGQVYVGRSHQPFVGVFDKVLKHFVMPSRGLRTSGAEISIGK